MRSDYNHVELLTPSLSYPEATRQTPTCSNSACLSFLESFEEKVTHFRNKLLSLPAVKMMAQFSLSVN